MNLVKITERLRFYRANGFYTFTCAVLTVIIMPVYVKLISPILLLWLLVWIFENYYSFNGIFGIKRKFLLLFFFVIAFYMWQVIGITYSNNSSMAISNAFGRLSMILFPLILIKPGKMIKDYTQFLLRLFAISTFGYIVICFIYAFIKSTSVINGHFIFNPVPSDYVWLNYFFGADLSISHHPTYISMYVLFSIFIGFENFFNSKHKSIYRTGWLLLSILLCISLYFLSSRAAIGVAIILIPLYLFIKLFEFTQNSFSLKLGLIILTPAFIIAIAMIFKDEQNRDKLASVIYSDQANNKTDRDPRSIIWNTSVEMSLQNLLIGVGIGDVRDELSKEYAKIGEFRIARERMNAHNQYLEFLLEGGLVGLILFLSGLAIMIYIAYSEKFLLYALFIAITSSFFLFESVLYRFGGISFYYLFAFLCLNLKGEKFEYNG